MRPESGFQKMAMTSQFSDMTSLPDLFDLVLLLFSSLVTGTCQYHHWFWSYENLLL